MIKFDWEPKPERAKKLRSLIESGAIELKINEALRNAIKDFQSIQEQAIAQALGCPIDTGRSRSNFTSAGIARQLFEDKMLVEREIMIMKFGRIQQQIMIRYWRRLRVVTMLNESLKLRKN